MYDITVAPSLFVSYATNRAINPIAETVTIFTVIAYELYKTALYRLNFISVSNPANGAKTMMKMKRIIDNIGDDEKFVFMYTSML